MIDIAEVAKIFRPCPKEDFFVSPNLDLDEFEKAKKCCELENITPEETIAFLAVTTVSKEALESDLSMMAKLKSFSEIKVLELAASPLMNINSTLILTNKALYIKSALDPVRKFILRPGMQVTRNGNKILINNISFDTIAPLALNESFAEEFVEDLQKFFDSLQEGDVDSSWLQDPRYKAAQYFSTDAFDVRNEEYLFPDFVDSSLKEAIKLIGNCVNENEVLYYHYSNDYKLYDVTVITTNKVYSKITVGGVFTLSLRRGQKVTCDKKQLFIDGLKIGSFSNPKLPEDLQKYIDQLPEVQYSESEKLAQMFSPVRGHLYVAPDFDEEKLNNAIKAYAPQISKDMIVLQYDETLSGSGEKGFLLTADKIFFKDGSVSLHRQINVGLENSELLIGIKKVFLSGLDDEQRASFLEKLKKYIDQLPEVQYSESEKLAQMFSPVRGHLYVAPDFDEEKLNNAIKAYAPQISKDMIVLQFDETLFGSGENGFLLTADKIFFKDGSVSLHRQINVGLENSDLLIGSKKLFLLGLDDEQRASFLEELKKYIDQLPEEKLSDLLTQDPRNVASLFFSQLDFFYTFPNIPDPVLKKSLELLDNCVEAKDVIGCYYFSALGIKTSFVLTADKMYAKIPLEPKHSVSLHKGQKITCKKTDLFIDGSKIFSFLDDCEKFCNELQSYVEQLPEVQAIGAAAAAQSFTRSVDRMYVYPEFDDEKLDNAIKAYAPQVDKETVLVLFDSTMWGSGKEGFLLTPDKLYHKALLEDPLEIPLYKDMEITYNGGNTIILDGKKISLLGSRLQNFSKFLEELQQYIRQLSK